MPSATVTLLVVSATLAFGAVYPWGYWPLFVAAASIGLAGLVRQRREQVEARSVAIGGLLVALAVGGQLIPLPRAALDVLSPKTAALLSRYNLSFALTSDSRPLSMDSNATALGLVALVSLGIYVVGLSGLMSQRDLRTLPRNLIIFAVLLALIGIYGREHNNGLVYGFWKTEEGTNRNGFGPFVNRNHFAGWMLMASCLAIGGLCGRIERVLDDRAPPLRKRIVWLSSSDANRIALLAASVVVLAVSLVWTMSRSGIVSFTCAAGCFAWLIVRRRGVSLARRLFAVAVVGAALVTGLNTRGVDLLAQWFADTTDVVSRLAAWRDGWQVVRDFPIAGTGINTYGDTMLFYQRTATDVWMTHAHNDYLQLLAEGGLLVSVPVIIAGVLLVTVIRRRLNEARNDPYEYWIRAGAAVGLIAIAIQEVAEFSLHIPANALLFATLTALAIAPTRQSSQSRAPARVPGESCTSPRFLREPADE